MRKGAVALLLLVVAVLPLSAASEFMKNPPWGPPVPGVNEGKTLIAVGFWADAIGIGLIAGSSAGYSMGVGVGSGLMGAGMISMLFVGNPCLQAGMTAHQKALDARKIKVSPVYAKKSRLFSTIELICGGGALALGVGAIAADSIGLAIASDVVGVGGAVLEIINFYMYRRNWGIDMKKAAGVPIQ